MNCHPQRSSKAAESRAEALGRGDNATGKYGVGDPLYAAKLETHCPAGAFFFCLDASHSIQRSKPSPLVLETSMISIPG